MDHCPEHSAHDRAIRDHDKQFEKADPVAAFNEALAKLRALKAQA